MALLLITSFGCSQAPQQRPNLVLVSIDTLRPDHLGCYGYERDTSATIDRLAAQGTLFERVSSTSSWTLPAHAAMFTGLHDPLHGVINDLHVLPESRQTLAEVLVEAGYATAGVFSGAYLSPGFGLDQGFEVYSDQSLYPADVDRSEKIRLSEIGWSTDGVLDWVEAWLQERDDRPFFLFVHLFDVHNDYTPPAPYDRLFAPDYEGPVDGTGVVHHDEQPSFSDEDLAQLEALYDGEIRAVDERGIARLRQLLESEGALEDTIIAITSDHGEAFGEMGRVGHRLDLSEATVRIPLILWGPGTIPAGVRVTDFVRLVDLMPTLLDLVGLEPANSISGRSLEPLLTGRPVDWREEPAFLLLASRVWQQEGIVGSRHKLVTDRRKRRLTYFDLELDPSEERPINDPRHPGFISTAADYDRLRKVILRHRTQLDFAEQRRLGDDERRRLESLGYLD